MEARIVDNQIVVPIGTAISFKMVAKNEQKIQLKVTESEDNSKFFVLFDENDVDFEIDINNTKCIHGIGYTLIVNNGFYDYYVGAGERWSMEALYSRGRKLHFISENSEEGQNVIKETAEEYDITYSESAALCSRIEFNFEVEKVVPKPLPQFKTQMRGNSFLPSFGCLSANRSLSLGRDVTDTAIEFESREPTTLSSLSKKSSNLASMGRSMCEPLFASAPIPAMASLSKTWAPVEDNQRQQKTEPQVGDKGVVCFGEQSSQLYNPYNGFVKDTDLQIKPFVVELRFSKKCQ